MSEGEKGTQHGTDAHHATWKIRDVAIGLAVLAAWYGLRFIDPRWFGVDSPRLHSVAMILPIAGFLFAYPVILARRRGVHDPFCWIGRRKPLVEILISVPLVIIVVAVGVAMDAVIRLIAPEASVFPTTWEQMAWAPDRALVLLFMLWAFTIGPVCEEVFFRGFLYNALRMRLPIAGAAVIQSLIFAAMHEFAWAYLIGVFVTGMLLTGIYQWRQALITPICVHVGVNLLAVLAVACAMIAFANSPVLGVKCQDHPAGCLVQEVIPDTAAEQVGIRPGDIITDVNGEPIVGFNHLIETICSYRAGDTVVVGIYRLDERLEIPTTLRARPEALTTSP